jgi:hypothetical protein
MEDDSDYMEYYHESINRLNLTLTFDHQSDINLYR